MELYLSKMIIQAVWESVVKLEIMFEALNGYVKEKGYSYDSPN